MAIAQILDPELVLQRLKSGAKSPRTVKSLGIIHKICGEQHQRGSPDFSYETIGKLSEAQCGPKAQSIRNSGGAVYRTQIDAWARFAEGKTRKPTIPKAAGLDDDLLAMIGDPVPKILVQTYIAENKKLKHENQVLKAIAKGNVVVELTGKSRSDSDIIEVVKSPSFLLSQEREALRHAISPELMKKMGWTLNEQNGSVSKGSLLVFSPGFVSAIKKVLDNA